MSNLGRRLRNLDFDALSNGELLLVVAAGVCLFAALVWIGFGVLDPAPPRTLVLSAGRPGGGYYAVARRYQREFAKYGISLEVRESSGSVENLKRLRDPHSHVSLAFVQSGTATPEDLTDPHIESIASLYYEPLIVFHHLPNPINRLSQLRGKRIAIGEPGSGVLKAARTLLADNSVDSGNTELLLLSPEAGMKLLTKERLDAVFVIASADSPVVEEGFAAREHIIDFTQADAYVRRFPWLSELVLPRGSIDLGGDYPGADVHLVAPQATLLVRRGLSPALVYLLMEITTEVHHPAGLFERAGEFPKQTGLEFPQNAESVRYFSSGKPFFQRYLPFWAANRIERALIILVPLLVIFVPLLRYVPAIVHWRKKARVNRLYGELREAETRCVDLSNPQEIVTCERMLSVLEAKANALHLPLEYGADLYQLRLHIALLRRKLREGVPLP